MSAPPWASCCPVCPSVPSFLQVAGPCCVLLILGLFLPLQVESSLSGTCTPFQKPVLLRSVALNLSSGRIAGRAFTGSLTQTQAAGGPVCGVGKPPTCFSAQPRPRTTGGGLSDLWGPRGPLLSGEADGFGPCDTVHAMGGKPCVEPVRAARAVTLWPGWKGPSGDQVWGSGR